MAEDPKSIAVGKRCIEDVLRHGTGSAVAVSNDQRTRANAKAKTIADTQSRDGHCRTAPSPNVVFRKGFLDGKSLPYQNISNLEPLHVFWLIAQTVLSVSL